MTSTPCILVVDDEAHVCTSLKILLARQGYEIYTANSGQQAIAIMESRSMDLILLDMMIPDMNGFQIMSHISMKSPDSLIIVITGNASIESAVAALKKGAFDYLKKPFEHEELLKRVGNALNQKQLSYEKAVINGKLKHTEEKYQSLVQNSPDLIYMLDKDNNFCFANVTFEKLLGFSPEQLLGEPFESIIADRDFPKSRRLLSRDVSSFQSLSSPSAEICLKGSDPSKKTRIFEVTHSLIETENPDNGEKDIVIHGTARDITYNKDLENQLIHAKKMEAVGTLTSGLAHDYNNILTSILGYTSLIQLEVSPDAPFYSKLEGIEHCVDRGAKLTRQLLDFGSKKPAVVVPANINDIIQKTAQMYGSVNKKVTIESDFISKIWSVKVNINQIEQMLLNLLINAGHAMPAGGTIYLKTENVDIGDTYQNSHVSEPGRYVKVTVRDTGTGMTEETKQRIFEPFFTTKEEGRGTGLGLASVYSTIKKHGGGVTVESRVGEGTVFNIFLPSVNSTKRNVEERNRLQGTIHKGLGTILLVDDDEAIAGIGKESLESLGYNVLIATNGDDGLKLYLKYRNSISLVIIDLIMPEMSGGELFDRLKEIDPHIKVLFTTGCNSNDEVKDILRRGCNGFIRKPFGIERLSCKLKEIMPY